MNYLKGVKGFVFDIQHYSIHDGPGIRTTVFLSGCPLACLWCQNPESRKLHPQLSYIAGRCKACGRCIEACDHKAVTLNGTVVKTNRRLCIACGKCTDECPNEARVIIGREITAGEVFAELASDAIFYDESDGGITLSGGEVLLQPAFAAAILELCRNENIHTAVETSGYGSWDIIRKVLKNANLVLYDFKHFSNDDHKNLTGVSNQMILENVKKIWQELKIPILARIPVIPGYNDSNQNMEQTAAFISSELDKSIRVHLLPYHRLGEGKRLNLELTPDEFAAIPPSDFQMNQIKHTFESFGLEAFIGG
jgi:pyruvate formate lyase activating enzyme